MAPCKGGTQKLSSAIQSFWPFFSLADADKARERLNKGYGSFRLGVMPQHGTQRRGVSKNRRPAKESIVGRLL